jgi:LmbE family N-acetylglucosaminyl deacetylase
VNHDKDSHQDHRVLAQCVVAGTRFNKRILYYESVTSLSFQPDIFVDIGEVLKDKLHVIEAFKSQITRNLPSGPQLVDGIKAMAGFRGFQAKVNYAEGFKSVRYHKLDF